jgi:hypothetical protein
MSGNVCEIAFPRPNRTGQIILDESKLLGDAVEWIIIAEKQGNPALAGRKRGFCDKALRFSLLDQKDSAWSRNLAEKCHTSLDWSSRGRG